MAVADLLMSQRRWGQTRCRKFLAQIPMSEKKTVGSMTDRQRRTLAVMLNSVQRGRAWSVRPLANGQPQSEDTDLPPSGEASIQDLAPAPPGAPPTPRSRPGRGSVTTVPT